MIADHKIYSFDNDDVALTCTCGETWMGYSWQDVGGKFDSHLNHVDEMEARRIERLKQVGKPHIWLTRSGSTTSGK